ncbi:hypothetical protein OtV6_198 [Ostreococcus tauri virus RT-2011]|nr:hypothetical protein OtV6_198 [Ostreococcus tauri virus RT-2011]
MVLKISSERYLMVRTLKRFGYWSPPPSTPFRRRYNVVAASKSEDIHYELKKNEITRIALEHMYTRPHIREEKQITPRQMRLKMILHEALDIAHSICEHSDTNAEECMWAWEMVDEIDDAATRAGVKYQ